MKGIYRNFQRITAVAGITLVALAISFGAISIASAADSLYVGDAGDNTVKKFDAATGAFQGLFVKSQGGLHAPIGIVFDASGDLFVANQNAKTGVAGEILEYGPTGKLLAEIVKNNSPNAPQSPQGMILFNGSLFVADVVSAATKSDPFPPGTLRKYNVAGVQLGAFVAGSPYGSVFHPRAVVLGPDGLLYVTNAPNLVPPAGSGLGGQVFRFNPNTGAFVDTLISSAGGPGNLNRPQGIVFGPDGKLYITSFRADATDNDKIFIYDGATLVGHINLDTAGETRSYAQALLFGPGGKLFVPITNTGEVRSYDVTNNTYPYDSFVPAGGQLDSPWFLTFGKTNSSTLVYSP